ncbi:pyrimidine 5'-nucleotidase [Rhinocladiella mackenziei CBS 650.93]|uniref:Pyrimidine 5'-nucleotidase n=1 Tax=Rhinocladiella mackenziei CBS 650.93 TaxID=1442369 RepID=A0A0D2IPU4_9EURO|nr:pyrimidine 5'-nucleotidase [Rhinocladiella mackenziei CBS 650.93]KIX05206.1 pyrimidine 5'-nucleotidase [Rhinocladiella mackenziei CBS 650.93]
MGAIEPLPTSTARNKDKETRAIFFFDIDNCLYPKSKNVHDHMALLINRYFIKHLDVSTDEATRLHQQYYKDYGLAIEGLSRHHKIDPMDFNREVDDALPLDDLLSPNPETRSLLEAFDRSKVKLWLFTNAHITHGRRVVRLLGIEDLFEGITYCDYSQQPLVPKPLPEMFAKAEREAGVTEHTQIYYVDDSYLNCQAAYKRGWTNTVHLVEPQIPAPPEKACKYQISHLRQLSDLFPELLRKY